MSEVPQIRGIEIPEAQLKYIENTGNALKFDGDSASTIRSRFDKYSERFAKLGLVLSVKTKKGSKLVWVFLKKPKPITVKVGEKEKPKPFDRP